MAEDQGETKPKVEGGNDIISIKVKDQSQGEVVFKVKRTTKFSKIFEAFCQKKAWDSSSVRFVFDGERLTADSTPADHDMDNDDSIDAFIEQLGGCC